MPSAKNPLKSWTIWFNIGLIALGLWLPSQSDAVRIALICSGISNLGLRFKTRAPVSLRKPDNT